MGIFGLFKKQFIDIIEWNEENNEVLAYRYPMKDREIQNGAQMTVRDTQVAMFVNEGELADFFPPGMHKLATKNLPVLTNLKHWDKFFESPFKSDVYFFSTRERLDQRWGTANPITFRDQELGPIRLRAHGIYSYKIQNPKVFYRKVSGTRDVFTTSELEGQLRSVIATSIATFFGSARVSFLDMASNQLKFSEVLKAALVEPFANYGLSLESFFVQSVSLPEELQAHMDKIAAMNMVGDLKKYAQFQSADSISIAARNESGAAGAGVGMGAGVAMGQAMSQALSNSNANNQISGPAAVAANDSEDPLQMIHKLHEMVAKGILTQSEFDAKKAELLKKIT